MRPPKVKGAEKALTVRLAAAERKIDLLTSEILELRRELDRERAHHNVVIEQQVPGVLMPPAPMT